MLRILDQVEACYFPHSTFRGFVLGGVLGVIWTCHVALKQGSSRQQISMMSYLMASDFFSCAMLILPSYINFSLILGHVVFLID